MTSVGELAVIEREGSRILELGRAAPGRVVPQYPTWSLAALVVHVAGVHARTAAICRTLPRERIPIPEPPDGHDPFDWAEEQLGDMLGALATADPDAEVWTFVPSPRLAFWGPRMVIETGLHRWDAQSAVGDPDPLLPVVAADGLDEFGDLYLARLGDVPAIELVATDLGRSWQFGKGDPATIVEATASDLFLRLMSRPGAALPPAWEAAVDALPAPAK